MENKDDKSFYKNLIPYTGEQSAVFIEDLTEGLFFHLKITRARDSKYGDYCPSYKGRKQRITINGNLDKYSFLITFLHELAHLLVNERLEPGFLPHGKEWKSTFRQLLHLALDKNLFPANVAEIVRRQYIIGNNFTHTSRALVQNEILRSYNKQPPLRLASVPLKGKVSLKNGMNVVKLKQNRTRSLCKCLNDNKMYYVSNVAEVYVLPEDYKS